ncbi:MAG: tRNA (adenosine(37)-N6)-dimethylallyltransferase MiaA [bacterium]
MSKVIAILGPTASGKTNIGVKLAYELNGEIVSADSRQVYRGMDIGTGKDLTEYEINGKKIPYHLIDVADPNEVFDLARFQKQAFAAIDDILSRNKLPIIVGGTGLYLQALVDNYKLSEIDPDQKLREKLEKYSEKELLKQIEKLNPEILLNISKSDKKNKRRLIRYVEIIKQGERFDKKGGSKYDWLLVGIEWPIDILRKRIYNRLIDRFENHDMVDEVKRLHEQGVNWQRLENFGLEYKYIAQYLQNKIKYDEMVEKLNFASGQFAKRQMSWYRRWEKQGAKIFWSKDYAVIKKMIKEWQEGEAQADKDIEKAMF